jgi:hypothetical protein
MKFLAEITFLAYARDADIRGPELCGGFCCLAKAVLDTEEA